MPFVAAGVLWGALLVVAACSSEIDAGGKTPPPTPTRAAGPTPSPSPIDRNVETNTDVDNDINIVVTPSTGGGDPVIRSTVLSGGTPGVVSTVVMTFTVTGNARELWTCRELDGPGGAVSHCAQFLVDPARTADLQCVSTAGVARQLVKGGNCPAQGYVVKCHQPAGYTFLAQGVGVYAWYQYVSGRPKAEFEQACRATGGTVMP